MKKSIKSDSLLWPALFISATYILSWIIWAPWLFHREQYGGLRILGSFAPSFIGIIFIRINNLPLKKRFFQKCSVWIYICIACYSLLSLFVPYSIAQLIKLESFFVTNLAPNGFNIYNPIEALLFFALIMIIGGPLGEELGWRGYLLPKLMRKFSPLFSAILVGIVWATWHLPMFIFKIPGYTNSFWLYLIQTIHLSIIYTWIYVKSCGNLIIPLLFHTIDNFVLSIFFQDQLNSLNWYSGLYYGIQILLDIFIIWDFLRMREQNKITKIDI